MNVSGHVPYTLWLLQIIANINRVDGGEIFYLQVVEKWVVSAKFVRKVFATRTSAMAFEMLCWGKHDNWTCEHSGGFLIQYQENVLLVMIWRQIAWVPWKIYRHGTWMPWRLNFASIEFYLHSWGEFAEFVALLKMPCSELTWHTVSVKMLRSMELSAVYLEKIYLEHPCENSLSEEYCWVPAAQSVLHIIVESIKTSSKCLQIFTGWKVVRPSQGAAVCTSCIFCLRLCVTEMRLSHQSESLLSHRPVLMSMAAC